MLVGAVQAGPIAFVKARHPVLDAEAAPFQPNDTYLALSSSFHIITGGGLAFRVAAEWDKRLGCVLWHGAELGTRHRGTDSHNGACPHQLGLPCLPAGPNMAGKST